MKSVAACILGCRVNQSEGESFLEYFKQDGYPIVDFDQTADVYLIHTCTVTGQADSKSRQMIRKARKANPEAVVVVTGCYAQTEAGVLREMPEVDLILGMKDRNRITELVELYKERKVHVFNVRDELVFEDLIQATPDTTRAFLKIQEGCDSFCSYCIIPIARGPVRSRKPEEILDEIGRLEAKGFREIVLTGIHAGAYGKDLGTSLSALMEAILEQTGIERIRFGSLDPNEIDPEFIRLFANSRFMPHIHLALQSGDDFILKKMNRKYDTALYRMVVGKLRETKGELLSVTTDVMTGFPGEGETEHQNSMAFIREIGLDNLHIFKYSKRKGTRAAGFPEQVEEPVKKRRSKELAGLKEECHNAFLEKMVGRTMSVLVEKALPDGGEGYSDNYLKVRILDGAPCRENDIIRVRIDGIHKDYLTGGIN